MGANFHFSRRTKIEFLALLLGPNLLIFSFSSGVLSAPYVGRWVLPLSIASRYFSQKNSTNMMQGGSQLM